MKRVAVGAKTLATVAGLLCSLLLAACGGGGGGGGGAGGGADVDIANLWRQLLQNPRSWVVSGVASDGQTFRLSSAYAAADPAVFPVQGLVAGRTVQTSRVEFGGVDSGTTSTTLYYDRDTLLPMGTIDESGDCANAITTQALPFQASFGSSGTIATLRNLLQCSVSSGWNGLLEMNWSIEREGELLLFCANSRLIAASGSPLLATQGECYELSASGALGSRVRLSLSVVSSGFSVVARNY